MLTARLRNAGERIIVSLDNDELNLGAALAVVEKLGAAPHGYSVQSFWDMLGGAVAAQSVRSQGARRVFADLKIDEVPSRAANRAAVISAAGADIFTVHIEGGFEMMRQVRAVVDRAAEKSGRRPLILGVTVLTSKRYEDFVREGFFPELDPDVPIYVRERRVRSIAVRRACLAQEVGLDGVVVPPVFVEAVREACGKDLLIVASGIRSEPLAGDDHNWMAPAEQAIQNGADLVVIGRPITTAADPVVAFEIFADKIAAVLAEREASS